MKNKFIIINILFSFLICQMKTEYTNPVLKSAILPGWGELDLNNKKRSNQFFIQEASIWITYFGLQYVSNSYESDYRAFASLHAGVDMIDKSYQYSVDIGDYNTYEEFIDAKSRNRQSDQIWPEGYGYEWSWDSEQNRKDYDQMRIISGVAKKYSKFAVGAMIANRIISVIDVLYLKNLSTRYQVYSSVSKLDSQNIEYSFKIIF
tara:strand:+ start:78 stop:692 length:615 start_codon:yes stop_codon:yes gene_type:complete